MKSSRRANAEASYDRDFFAWSSAQAHALRRKDTRVLDWENLAEEIESLGRSDRRGAKSRLKVLMVHLLKWSYQSERRSISWKTTIESQREELAELLNESPSLRRQVPVLMEEAYRSARRDAASEMGLISSAAEKLPQLCPFTPEQLLDENFLPE